MEILHEIQHFPVGKAIFREMLHKLQDFFVFKLTIE